MKNINRFISQLNNNIVRVSYTFEKNDPQKSELISGDFLPKSPDVSIFREAEGSIEFIKNGKVLLKEKAAALNEKEVFTCFIDGEPKIGTKLTANGEVTFIENAESKFERFSNSGLLKFEIGEDELLLGLGQYEDGIFDYRNHTEYLYQSNMRIAIPFLITTGGYAIFVDTESNMLFKSQGREIEFEIDTTKDLVYYIISGSKISELIESFQMLTGYASMLPRWVYGYVQSKERYKSGEELVSTLKEFRERHIPIDCIVQDWYSWDDGLWGEKIFDKNRYPDLKGTVDTLHDMNGKLMVSIWPNMSPVSKNYADFTEAKGLLDNSNVYNAFDEEFRSLYWTQCENEIMSSGTDALWCDNSEPFSDADWNGQNKRPEELRCSLVVEDSKKSMKWEQLNTYGLYHAKGIYENWRKSLPEKRVVNLTRSGYASGQKYGTILWSGDITAKWDTIRKQIVEGLKMGLSGNPYWTLDIGGFFTVKDKYENRGCNNESTDPLWFWNGDFNDGVLDPGYRELYTRWLQFGTFLPMFRSHGTDTPREPWNFINQDGITLPFYETILKYIDLRYKLLPYIYSLAYKAHTEAYIMMRSFVFDFADDSKAINCKDEYMFGDAFLVAPVYEPMYYGPNGQVIDNVAETRKVYLPENSVWYDFETNKCYEGGQTIIANAPLETMPLFVRAGSIIPMSDRIEYTGQNNGAAKCIMIYEGNDGSFNLYNDKGDGYEFENGEYSLLSFSYKDKEKTLEISASDGDMTIKCMYELHFVHSNGEVTKKDIWYSGESLIINF